MKPEEIRKNIQEVRDFLKELPPEQEPAKLGGNLILDELEERLNTYEKGVQDG